MENKLKKYKKLVGIFFVMIAFIVNAAIAAPANSVKTKTVQPVKSASLSPIVVDPIAVVNNPATYLNKSITFEANFVAFTALGLDYNPALKSSNEYIGILIQRTDVKDHVIPLSEMKMFLTRDEAEKHVDLEQGDKIKITGTVFSTALGDPWIDIKTFTVLENKNKKKN